MKYTEFGNTGCKISRLGFGAMRLPMSKDDCSKVDIAEAIGMIRYAVDNGVNYLDTAYFYHDGESEKIVGSALKDGYRDKVYLATKLPVGHVKAPEDFDKILNTQLDKLQTDHIDFYLFHTLNKDYWETVKKFGLIDKMKKAKSEGKIRHIGFSFHDSLDVFYKIVDEFDGCEFCQIMLNYVDTENQAGIDGMNYAVSKGLGVIVMEPIRGGALANPSDEIKKALPEGRTPVENALAFLWDKKEVSLLLSGMSTFEQVEQNLKSADKYGIGCLTDDERSRFVQAKKIFFRPAFVPCSDCKYCQPCPNDVKIPDIFAAYNKYITEELSDITKVMPDISDNMNRCVACGTCEEKCPQQIKITERFKDIIKRI